MFLFIFHAPLSSTYARDKRSSTKRLTENQDQGHFLRRSKRCENKKRRVKNSDVFTGSRRSQGTKLRWRCPRISIGRRNVPHLMLSRWQIITVYTNEHCVGCIISGTQNNFYKYLKPLTARRAGNMFPPKRGLFASGGEGYAWQRYTFTSCAQVIKDGKMVENSR